MCNVLILWCEKHLVLILVVSVGCGFRLRICLVARLRTDRQIKKFRLEIHPKNIFNGASRELNPGPPAP